MISSQTKLLICCPYHYRSAKQRPIHTAKKTENTAKIKRGKRRVVGFSNIYTWAMNNPTKSRVFLDLIVASEITAINAKSSFCKQTTSFSPILSNLFFELIWGHVNVVSRNWGRRIQGSLGDDEWGDRCWDQTLDCILTVIIQLLLSNLTYDTEVLWWWLHHGYHTGWNVASFSCDDPYCKSILMMSV